MTIQQPLDPLRVQQAAVGDEGNADAPRPAGGDHVEEARMQQRLALALQLDMAQARMRDEEGAECRPVQIALLHRAAGAEAAGEAGASARRLDLGERTVTPCL